MINLKISITNYCKVSLLIEERTNHKNLSIDKLSKHSMSLVNNYKVLPPESMIKYSSHVYLFIKIELTD